MKSIFRGCSSGHRWPENGVSRASERFHSLQYKPYGLRRTRFDTDRSCRQSRDVVAALPVVSCEPHEGRMALCERGSPGLTRSDYPSPQETVNGLSEGLTEGLETLLYNVARSADAAVADQLTGVSPATYLVVLLSGLVTSLSPCTLSVLPLTIGYIGGYGYSSSPEEGKGQGMLASQAVSFSFGLATTLALLGIASSSLGKVYGQYGEGLPLAVSLLAVLMGLNLLEVVPLALPSIDVDVRSAPVPAAVKAYLAGLTFALAASPCSTPVLATLLAFVSSTDDPIQGGGLLLAYSMGYVAPLLLAASVTGAMKQLLSLRQFSAWFTPTSGCLLVAGGTYSLLSRLFPA